MCPDRQMISLYFDGELPSPWKEKMEAHLVSCPECRSVLAGYRNLGQGIGKLPDETILAARERVWNRLGEAGPPRRAAKPAVWKKAWGRTITLPLPAAAAAAVAVIAIMLFTVMGIRGGDSSIPQESIAALDFDLDDFGPFPVQDMSGVLQYLSSQDNGDFMVIRLPESKKFSSPGKPAFINAADYSRRNIPR